MTTKKNTKKPAPRSIRRAFPQVENIVDAKNSVSIHVKDSDCKSAEPLNPSECALARATKREFKVDAVVIGLSTSYIIKGKKAIRFQTPTAVQREIVSFDRHSDFQPGNYYLVPKAESNSLEAQREYRRNKRSGAKKGKNHGPTRKYHHTAKVREFKIE